MKKYKSHPHLDDWIVAMNGELLSPPELDVLDFIGWCKKYGCRTSNDRIGERVHHSHKTVERAIARIYELNLVAIDNYGKRTRTIKPITWLDRQAWENREKNPILDKTHPGHFDPHISTTRESLRSLSRRGVAEAGKKQPAGESSPQTPAGSSVQGSEANPPPTADDIERREKALFEVAKMGARNKLMDLGHSEEKVNALADTRAHQAIRERQARKK